MRVRGPKRGFHSLTSLKEGAPAANLLFPASPTILTDFILMLMSTSSLSEHTSSAAAQARSREAGHAEQFLVHSTMAF